MPVLVSSQVRMETTTVGIATATTRDQMPVGSEFSITSGWWNKRKLSTGRARAKFAAHVMEPNAIARKLPIQTIGSLELRLAIATGRRLPRKARAQHAVHPRNGVSIADL